MLISTLPTCILNQTAPSAIKNKKELGSITPPSSSQKDVRQGFSHRLTVLSVEKTRGHELHLTSPASSSGGPSTSAAKFWRTQSAASLVDSSAPA